MISYNLLAVSLGIISVIITLKYVQYYDAIVQHLEKLTVNNNSHSTNIIELQESLNISDKELDDFFKNHKNSIISLYRKKNKKEGFTNYNYLDHKQRGLRNYKFSKYKKKGEKKEKNPKFIKYIL